MSQEQLMENEATPPGEHTVLIRSERDSSNRGWKIGGFTLLGLLLIAGQAITVYFVMAQKGQISSLQEHTDILKKQLNNQQHAPLSPPKKLRMPMFNMPMLVSDSADEKPKKIPMTPLEDTATVSLEKQVKGLLQQEDPDQTLPQFNETLLDNLKSLKEQMNSSDWKGFESWLRHWLLFQMAQKKPAQPTIAPVQTTTPMEESGVQSKCQLEASSPSVHPGVYRPQCDEEGNYLPKQCWSSTGYCWCVDKNGDELPETRTRSRLDCNFGLRRLAMPSFPAMKMIDKDN
ncbi:HLA class II histocompatibility antigen gamma chain-like [Acipenser ruthenus]|uniref:HLA class II histocompatibility antigen gamma chain-like n=1 Tax=Acipenser ruthenus TaxID=7906 RepID=UPI00145B5443|nr:HLA class II histocompatibility antigen gamma chain-like [Acipenser ruthenus]